MIIDSCTAGTATGKREREQATEQTRHYSRTLISQLPPAILTFDIQIRDCWSLILWDSLRLSLAQLAHDCCCCSIVRKSPPFHITSTAGSDQRHQLCQQVNFISSLVYLTASSSVSVWQRFIHATKTRSPHSHIDTTSDLVRHAVRPPLTSLPLLRQFDRTNRLRRTRYSSTVPVFLAQSALSTKLLFFLRDRFCMSRLLAVCWSIASH